MLVSLILALPLALDGEAVSANNTGIAVLAAVSMLACYIGLAALWYFVFRDKARGKRKKGSPPPD
jgi:peptidoglycan/LPS O-acetylase OafA/YrhL